MRCQSGQVLPVAIFTMAASIALCILLYNTAQRTIAKTRIVNAADAAAYSAATWSARHLNLMAYANRALIVNHVTAGHLTAYASWLRHGVDATGPAGKELVYSSGNSIKYMAESLDAIRPIAYHGNNTVEDEMPDLLLDMDATTQLYAAAQDTLADGFLASGGARAVMDSTVDAYSQGMRVNQDIDRIPARMQSGLREWIGSAQQRRRRLMIRHDTGTSTGRFEESLDAHMTTGLKRWVRGRRGWPAQTVGRHPGNVYSWRQRKRGTGKHTIDNGRPGWRAEDAFDVSMWRIEPPAWAPWNTVATGEASTDELTSGSYTGPRTWYETASGGRTLPYAVLVSESPQALAGNETTHRDFRGVLAVGAAAEPVTATGAAEAYFERPSGCGEVDHGLCAEGLASGSTELANLFNPFWKVRLLDYTFLLNHRTP